MNAKLSKIIAIVLSIVVIITSILTLASFATSTFITKKIATNNPFNEEYQKGSYTQYNTIDEVRFGILEFVDFITDFRYALLVSNTQAHEQTVRDIKESIKEVEKDYASYIANYDDSWGSDYFQDRCEEFEERIDELEKDIVEENDEFKAWKDENYKSEDFEILSEKLADADFLNSVAIMYVIESSFETQKEEKGRDAHTEDIIVDDKYEISDSEKKEILEDGTVYYYFNDTVPMVINIVGGFCIGIFALITLISMITLLVMTIKSIVKLIGNAKKSNDARVIFERNELNSVAITSLVMIILTKMIYGAELVVGPWISTLVILLIVNSVCSMIINLIDKKFNIAVIIKTVINAVCVVLAAILLTSVINLGIANTAIDKIEDFSDKVFYSSFTEKYMDLLEDNEDRLEGYLEENDMESYEDLKNSLKQQATSYARDEADGGAVRVAIILGICMIIAIFTIAAFGKVISLFAGAVIVTKEDPTPDEYGEAIVGPVIAIAACIALSVFTINNANDLDKSILNSEYNVFVGEYAVEDTVDYELYEELEDSIEEYEEFLKDADEEIAEITDEDEKENAIAIRDLVVRQMNVAKNKRALLLESDYSMIKYIALFAIILVLQIEHKVIAKIDEKKKSLIPTTPTEDAKEESKEEEATAPMEEPTEEPEANPVEA